MPSGSHRVGGIAFRGYIYRLLHIPDLIVFWFAVAKGEQTKFYQTENPEIFPLSLSRFLLGRFCIVRLFHD